MKVVERLKKQSKTTHITYEVLPPLKGGSMDDIFKMLDPLMEFKPPFVDVTYHREEFVYKERSKGYYEKIAIRKRPGTVGICAAIKHRYGVEAVPHLICGGFTREETENALIDLKFLDIQNVLAIRGDARQFDKRFIPEDGGNIYAIDLVRQIGKMNQGVYLDDNIENGQKTNFCIGIAGYPEKHFEAPNIESDLKHTKAKIDAGAGYIVTQMVFNNKRYFEYVDRCREYGIDVPIIPGLKPITSRLQMQSIPRHFYVDMPAELVQLIQKAKTPKDIKEAGIEWCVHQAKELKAAGVPCIHFFIMNSADTILKIVRELH